MSLPLAGGFLFYSLSPRQKVYFMVVLFRLNYTILPLKQIVQNLLSLTSACKILMSSALNWFLSPCVISMYRYSRKSWKYDHCQGQCFFEQQDHLGSVLNIYLPEILMQDWVAIYSESQMKENWSLEHWRLSWERTVFHCALFCLVCIFSSHVYYSHPFPSLSFSFIWLLMFLKCRVGLRNFHFNMVQYQALDWLLQRPSV